MCLVCIEFCSVAAPITHIVLTNKIYDTFFKDRNKERFIAGTSFPDIRYLANVPRESTHLPVNSIEDLNNDDDFMAGMRFHNLLDLIREKYVRSTDIYKKYPFGHLASTSLKFVEDKCYEDKLSSVGNKVSIDSSFNSNAYGISEEQNIRWYTAINSYITSRASEKGIEDFILSMMFDKSSADSVRDLVATMLSDPKIVRYTEGLYTSFDKIIFVPYAVSS